MPFFLLYLWSKRCLLVLSVRCGSDWTPRWLRHISTFLHLNWNYKTRFECFYWYKNALFICFATKREFSTLVVRSVLLPPILCFFFFLIVRIRFMCYEEIGRSIAYSNSIAIKKLFDKREIFALQLEIERFKILLRVRQFNLQSIWKFIFERLFLFKRIHLK